MDFSAPSRRALVVLVSALAGSLVVALVIAAVSPGGRDAALPTDRDVRAGQARDGAVRLAPEDGGVAAADVALDDLAPRTAAERRAVGAPLDTGRVGTDPFSMLGVTWRGGAATVAVRTRGDAGWSDWRPLPPLTDLPDAADGEGDPDLRSTQPVWVGRSDGVQVRVTGPDARDLDLALIQPIDQAGGTGAGSAATPALATTGGAGAAVATSARPAAALPRPAARLKPRLRSRRAWGANESWRSGRPSYNDTIKQVHVHHTVSVNRYSRSDVPGMIRGMYRYHTANLGWSDIGYNFLVDRFGRTWVGRAGGPRKAVRGAHTLGFNHASTGVSVIGNFETAPANKRIIKALAKLSAWKLAKYGGKARGYARVTSTGSDKFGAGRRVWLHRIDGHRDTNDTACPGGRLYERLVWVRKRAQGRIDRFRDR